MFKTIHGLFHLIFIKLIVYIGNLMIFKGLIICQRLVMFVKPTLPYSLM